MKNLSRLSLSGLLLLTACGGLISSDKPVMRTWMLMPLEQLVQAVSAGEATSVAVSLVATPGLDTSKILTLSSDAELNSLSAARWADHTPEMLKSLIARTLQDSGRFVVVTRQADCDLHLQVQEFFAYTGSSGTASEVRIEITGRYSCGPENSKRIQLQETISVRENSMRTIVASFQEGVNKILTELLEAL